VEGMLKKDQTAAVNKEISMIMALEDTYNINLKIDDFFVTLSAKFDRVHQTGEGKTVIVDYKTGELKALSIERLNPKSDKYNPEQYFELLFSEPDYSHSLQSWIYTYVYCLSQRGRACAEMTLPKVVLYVLKKREQDSETTFDLEAIEQEAGVKYQGYYLQQFEAMLIKKIKEIFDPTIPFREIIRPSKNF
jgi:hypothetical protein